MVPYRTLAAINLRRTRVGPFCERSSPFPKVGKDVYTGTGTTNMEIPAECGSTQGPSKSSLLSHKPRVFRPMSGVVLKGSP